MPLIHSIIGLLDPWKATTIILLVLNLKCLPFVWHYRIFSPIIRAACRHKLGVRHPVQPLNDHADVTVNASKGTPTVFLPFITTTHAPLLECDYNLHKSNSTYFTDLDASRSHLLSTLCYSGLRAVDHELIAEGKAGMLAAIIGSVTTSFKREIPMFRQYEVWSRILTWDQKWLYIVTHFVQKGSIKPGRFVAGSAPHMGRDTAGQSPENIHQHQQPQQKQKPAFVYATSVSKYVFKKGRMTIPPERILRASGLVHQALDNDVDLGISIPRFRYSGEPDGSLNVIEKQRLRGLQFADAWAKLDVLHDELLTTNEEIDEVVAVGQCGDIAGLVHC
ncbi:hypothetical protein ASPVEDRAFT_131453 [Aspergillus versicolor CBS 583.65]|uniref:Thioesterase domain-containing protein n=1 Tax=Aspergillus versicolor CBS 583.65 TaxID=1036611 RepID=A0A1L9PKP6_ASPVE|nr:uncharacterized protein ASPVEDRAFT_131453 [Aspergillus versicolor CBS 583.65]OJJ02016.1 hypothetical protein ASPVEDRAFT_131453 [Aspergillus versicolor CBS 583.65]